MGFSGGVGAYYRNFTLTYVSALGVFVFISTVQNNILLLVVN